MSKTTKIFVYPILTALMMLLNFTIVNGTHIVGGELTYKCLGNNEYEVTLIVRRDCENGAEDAPFDDPAVVGVFDIFGALQLHLGNLGEMELPFMGEDTVSNEIVFDCGALGGPVCVHEAVYRGTVSLPWNKIGYILAYQRCCRNTILNNIVEPLETGSTYYSRLEAKALEECNSQPVFEEWPDVYICVNEELIFDHAAVDQDGDQLVYKLCTPMAGATIDHPKPTPPGNPPYSTIEWLSPFNLNNLMGGDALEIDAQTGIITAKPNAIGTYLIGICVEEYRDGILLSTVRRDFEFNVRACTEPIAVDFEVEGMDCDLSISCTNLTEGADKYTWYFDYPNTNPQFISNDENPEFTYRENGTYTIRLEGKRNADGCTTFIDKTVNISDIPMVADFTSEFGSCEGGNMLLLTDQSYDTTQLSHAVDWEWIVEIDGVSTTYTGNPVLADIDNAELANITMNLLSSAGCESSIQKEIDLSGLFPHADFTLKLLECVDDGYALEVEFQTDTDTFEIDSIKWLVTDEGVDISYNGESFNFTSNAENLFIRMTVSYSNGCEKIVEREIDVTSFLPVLIISNDLNADCIKGDTTSINFFAELTGGNMDASPVSYTWNINGSPYSSDETITLEVVLGDTVDISLVILYDNNCTFEDNDQFVFEQGTMLAGFDAELDCKTIVDFNSTGLNVDQYLWYFDYPNADQGYTSTEANPSFDYTVPGIYTVRLEATRLSDSCMAIEEKVITVSDIPMIPDFDVAFESCENGRFIRLQDLSYDSTGVSHAVDVTWEVNYSGITEIFNGDSYILNIQNADEITVALTVVSSAGCTSKITETIDLTEVFPTGDILTTLLQCIDDGYLLDIAFINSDSSFTIESIQWTINDGGAISTQTGSSFQITSDAVDLSVMLVVNYTNGCVYETEQKITDDDFLPVLSIGYDQNIDCTGLDSIQLEFYPVLTGGNMDASPLSYMWTLDGEVISTLDTVVLLLSTTNATLIGLTVEYSNNCVFTTSEEFTCPECKRDPEILVEIDCADTEKLIVSLTDTTVLEQGITATFQQWIVNGNISFGPAVTFELESNVIEAQYQVEYSDGCSGIYTQTFEPDDFLVELSYDVEVLECLFGFGTFLFTNTSTFAAECVNVESIEWIIHGQSYTGDSVEVEILLGLTVDVELIIHFTNGTTISTSDDNDPTNDSVNTLDYIENVQFDIMDNTGVFCGDSINLSIVDPDPNLIYNWAFDSEFTNILFAGTELIIEANEIFNGLVFAQAISDSLCMYGQSLISLDDQEIILVFDTPFEICPGDTANFEIININPLQDITYTWKEGGDQLIDGADTNNPLIGIPEDHTDDFYMILCTENTAGCNRVDTVFFEVGETEDLEPFSFDIDSCGSLTVNFTANNTFNGTPFWDFGDGNNSNETNPGNTYPSPGTYLVVLSDSSEVCAKNSYMDSIAVPEMLYINIGQDTIEYGAGETVTVNAETNGPQDSIIWCLEDGTIIGMGNPLEYQPVNDIEEVCAKITDEYGCSDTTCVILKLREDCPEELSIDGPPEICVGDTFELMLMMDQDPAEFIFLWDPSECIISGGDTHNPTVTATTNKTFSVLVQKPGLCSDTIVTFNVSVSDPQVSITTENGEPNVCLGQEQTLLVVPDDPDCIYTWSTGETGPEIVVSPEVTTEYSVTCINNLGCESTSSFILEVILPECNENDVYLPNAFSPNGDNVNDVLLVRSKFIDEMEFYIVDRWGNEVFRTTDQNVGWDGTYKGEQCPPDAYAYYLMVVCIGGDDYFTQGNVSIIK